MKPQETKFTFVYNEIKQCIVIKSLIPKYEANSVF